MFKVRFRIGRIHELAGYKTVRDFFLKFVGFGNGAFHAFRAVGKDKFRAVCFHQLTAFDGHGFGHNNDDAVASCGGNRGKTDTGVAGGRFDDDRTRFQQSFFFGIVNHRFGDSVFYGTRRIEIFQFGENFRFQIQCFFNVRQFKKGGVADQLVGGSIYVCHSNISLIYKKYVDHVGNRFASVGSTPEKTLPFSFVSGIPTVLFADRKARKIYARDIPIKKGKHRAFLILFTVTPDIEKRQADLYTA